MGSCVKKSLGRLVFLIRHFKVKNHNNKIPEYNTTVILPKKQRIQKAINLFPKVSDCIYSPMLRAEITCKQFINHGLKYSKLNIEPAIQEQRLGILEGLSISDAWKNIENDEKHSWSFMTASFVPPIGPNREPSESFDQVVNRVGVYLNSIDPNPELPPLTIFTHAGVIRAAISYCMEVDLNKALGFKINYFSITCFEKQQTSLTGGSWQIHYINRDLN